ARFILPYDTRPTPFAQTPHRPSHHASILKTALHISSLGFVPIHLRALLDLALVRLENALLRQLLPLPEIAVARHKLFQHLDRDLACLHLAPRGLTHEGCVLIEHLLGRRWQCEPQRDRRKFLFLEFEFHRQVPRQPLYGPSNTRSRVTITLNS